MIAEAMAALSQKLHSSLNSCDRRAKIQNSDFICGLLQVSATASNKSSLVDLRQSVCQFMGCEIVQSVSNERMASDSLVRHLKEALSTVVISIANKKLSTYDGLLEIQGAKIIDIDGSLMSLWDGLANHWSGTFVFSAIKLHLATDLLTGSVSWLNFTEGSAHDSQCFPEHHAYALYFFDLGY
ncbi:MAG: transposase [Oligoflexales bacterium]